MDFDQLAASIGKQFATAWNNPAPFLAAVFLGWFAIRWHFSGSYQTRLDNSQSTIALLERQLQEYKDKLSGATPDEARARMDALEARIDQILPQVAALEPRRVTADQRAAMVAILDPFRGSLVQISSDAASADGAQLAQGFTAAFNSAAWHVVNGMVLGLGRPPMSGIGLQVSDPANLSPQENAVAAALRAAGLEFDIQEGRRQPTREGQPPVAVELIVTTRLRS